MSLRSWEVYDPVSPCTGRIQIIRRGNDFCVADLGSKNGTLLNGETIREERYLSNNDVITLGENVLTFSEDVSPEVEMEAEPAGAQVYSARHLSAVMTWPAASAVEIARQNRLLGILSQAASALVAHRPLPELFELILDLLFDAMPAERGVILLLEGILPQPAIKAVRSRSGRPIASVPRSITRRVIDERSSLLLPNIMEDVSLKDQASIISSEVRAAICAPLWFTPTPNGPDQVIGMVYLDTSRLSKAFTEDDLRILTTISNVAAAKIENARLVEENLEKCLLEEDLRMAAEVQAALLPRIAPVVPGYELIGSNRPCRAIGGDYYDFVSSEGRVLLALGDVSGKGTSAALLMTVLRAAVHAHWLDAAPCDAMHEVNRTICQNVPEGKFATLFLARLDIRSGRLSYVNAGHNPPLLVRAGGSVERLDVGGLLLGAFEKAVYEEAVLEVHPRDTLLVFSDGVTETWSAAGVEFGEQGLSASVRRLCELDARALEAELLKELDRYASGAKPTDDRTLIILKRGAE